LTVINLFIYRRKKMLTPKALQTHQNTATLNTQSFQSIASILALVNSCVQLSLKVSNKISRYGKVFGHSKRVANKSKVNVDIPRVFLI
jgi:hypothetical protein